MPTSGTENNDDGGMGAVLIVAIVLALLLITIIIVLVMCWKLRASKSNGSNNHGTTFSNPLSSTHAEDVDLIHQSKAKLVQDPFMLKRGTPLGGEDKQKFDKIASELQSERIKFLVILNSLRRDAKHFTPETDAFYTYRECIHELSRLLYCINTAPQGVVPEDGLYLIQWAKQILAIYDAERRIIALPYNDDYEEEEEPEGFQIQQLRGSMRARRSSLGSSEDSSLADSQIRVDVESEDEEEEMRNAADFHKPESNPYDDEVIINPSSLEEGRPDPVTMVTRPGRSDHIIAAPPQFSQLNHDTEPNYY